MTSSPKSTTLSPRPTGANAADCRSEAIRPGLAPRLTFIPATCEHADRPAWPVSETQLCHECEDRRFRAEMFSIGARTAGYPVTDQAALNMVDTLNSLASAVMAPSADRRTA